MKDSRCNLTIGYYSVVPAFETRLTDKGLVSTIPRLTRELNIYDRITSLRLLYKDAGNLAAERYYKMIDEQEIELIFLPFSLADQGLAREPLPVLFENGVSIVTLVPETSDNKALDISDSLSIIEVEVWTIFALIVVITSLILACLSRKKSTFLNLIWSFFSASLNQNSLNETILPSKILIVAFLALFTFLNIFFGASFNTKLVSVKEQFKVNYLQDLMDPRAAKYCPYFRAADKTLDAFELSENAAKKNIWLKAKTSCPKKASLTDDLTERLTEIMAEYHEKPIVLFLYEYIMISLHAAACSTNWLSNFGLKLHYAKEYAAKSLVSVMFNPINDSCITTKRHIVNFSFESVFEANIGKRFFIDEAYMMYIDTPFTNWKCLGWPELFPFVSHDQVKLANIKHFLFIYSNVILFSLFILLAEIILHIGSHY